MKYEFPVVVMHELFYMIREFEYEFGCTGRLGHDLSTLAREAQSTKAVQLPKLRYDRPVKVSNISAVLCDGGYLFHALDAGARGLKSSHPQKCTNGNSAGHAKDFCCHRDVNAWRVNSFSFSKQWTNDKGHPCAVVGEGEVSVFASNGLYFQIAKYT